MDKKIVVSSDKAGYDLKEAVKGYLESKGFEVTDVGTTDVENPKMYYEAAENIAKEVQSGRFERGIVFCGTGMGVSQVCNKFKGIYCALVESKFTAKKCRIINNSNIMALGGNVVTPPLAFEMVDEFLNTKFCEDCDADRTAYLTRMRAQCDVFGQE